MNRIENPIELEVLTLMFRNPDKKNISADEIYAQLNRRYRCERNDFNKALIWLDNNKFFTFIYDSSGDIESLGEITGTGYGVAMMMNLDTKWEAEDAAHERIQRTLREWREGK